MARVADTIVDSAIALKRLGTTSSEEINVAGTNHEHFVACVPRALAVGWLLSSRNRKRISITTSFSPTCAVCCKKRCNEGWMKDLEDAVLQLVGKMGEGTRTTLDVLQQWTVARWAIAKAMVWEHISRDKPIFYSDEDRFGLRDGTIPPNTFIWLAGHAGRETFFTMASDAHSKPEVVPRFDAYFTTFAYQRLVIQILSGRPHEYADLYSSIDCNQRVWADAIVRIWPTVSACNWPPMLILDDGMLERLHKRCSITEKDQTYTVEG